MQIPYAILGACILVFLIGKIIQLLVQHRRRLHIKLEAVPPGGDATDVRNPELPGRARVVQRAAPVAGEAASEPVRHNHVPGSRMPRPERAEPVFESAEEPFVVMPVGAAEQAVIERPVVAEAAVMHEPVYARNIRDVDEIPVAEIPVVSEPGPGATEVDVPVLVDTIARSEDDVPLLAETLHAVVAEAPAVVVTQHDMFAGEPVVAPARREPSLAERASALYETQALEPVNTVARAEVQDKVHEQVQDVIAVHVICRGVPFNGEDLLRCILSYGLRFGEMSIFHRHEQPTGQGRVLFSMAKAVEPGTFELETMTSDMIPGVSFFLSLPGVNSIQAYDIMIDTAKRLAHELNGDLLDLQQSPLTRQLMEHYRERVSEFERRRLMTARK